MHLRAYVVAFLSFAALACEKEKPPAPITPPVDSAPAAATTSAALPVPAPAPSVTVAAATTDAGKTTKPAGSGSASAAALRPASKHLTGTNFAIDVASPGCQAGADCVMTLALTVGGDWHVNKEYPYKFIGAPGPGVTFLGKTDANVFGRTTGDFVEQGEKKATLTVRFKAASAGETRVAGKYKLSVCSAAQCQIEEQAIDLPVPVI